MSVSIVFSESYSISHWGAIQANVRLTFAEAYNQSTNATTLTLTGLEFQKVGNASNCGSIPLYGAIAVNGTTICSFDNSTTGHIATVALNGSGYCAADLSRATLSTVTVTHDADGSKSVTVALSGGFTNGNTYFSAVYRYQYGSGMLLFEMVPFGKSTPASATMALTTRPRISSVSATNAYFGDAVTITLSRYNSAFTHTLKATCAGYTETIMTKGSTYPTVTWTPAVATYAPRITNAMSATATITCETYNGNNLVGTSTTTCTLTLKTSNVAPGLTVTIEDPQNLGYGKFVLGKSKIKVTATPSLKYGATLVSLTITANGETFTSSPATTGFVSSVNNTQVTVKIVDSRGQSATATRAIEIYDYSAPRISSFSAHRCNSDGTANNSGAYMYVSYNVSITSLGNGNSKSLVVKYKKTSASSWSSQTISMSSYTASGYVIIVADVNSSYDLRLELTDDFATTAATTRLPTATTHINHGAGVNGGIGIGQVSETNNAIEIASSWQVKYGGRTLPLLDSGWKTLTPGVKYRKHMGVVYIVAVEDDYELTRNTWVGLGTLPDGYRPSILVSGPFGAGARYSTYLGCFYLDTNGYLQVVSPAATVSTWTFTVCYPT